MKKRILAKTVFGLLMTVFVLIAFSFDVVYRSEVLFYGVKIQFRLNVTRKHVFSLKQCQWKKFNDSASLK